MSTAAELIAKIKVNGFSEYESTMKTAGHAMDTLAARAASAGQSLLRHLVTPLNAVIGLGGAAGMLGLTHSAIDQAAKIERLRMTYAALGHDLEGAGQKMDFVQRFAQTSIAHFDDLAEAGTLLEASGLRMERFLPTINNIAGAFGGTTEQVLELAGAFGRLASGQTGEAMERMRRFGITAGDLMTQGIRVGATGQINAPVEQIFGAIERAAQRKFGEIGTIMGSTIGVKFSNLSDAWHMMLQKFGEGWFPFVGKVLDSLTPFMNFLSQSGVLQGLGKMLGATISNLAGITESESIPRFLSYITAVVEQLPQVFETVGSRLKGLFEFLGERFIGFINTAMEGLTGGINTVKHQVEYLVNVIKFNMHELKAMATPFSRHEAFKPFSMGQDASFTPLKNPADIFERMMGGLTGGLGDNIGKRAGQIFAEFQKYQANPQAGVDGSKYDMFNNNYQAQIAQNTMKTAEATAHMADLKKFALGGGDLGAMGVTPTEMAGRCAVGANITVQGNDRLFKEWVHGVISAGAVAARADAGRDREEPVTCP